MAERQLSRNHHTIPAFYQRGFRDARARRNIWRYDKETGFLEHPPIKRESVIQDYYSYIDDQGKMTDQIETDLLSKVEDQGALVIDKMKSRASLTEDDRGTFAVFIAVMYVRTPFMRQSIDRIALALRQRELLPIVSDPEVFSRRTAEMEKVGIIQAGTNNEQFRNELLTDLLDPNFHKKWSVNREFSLGLFSEINTAAHHIYNMYWQIVSATDDIKFITSDTPVVIARVREEDGALLLGTGPRNPDAELTFPITKELAFWGDHRRNREYHYVSGGREVVGEINKRTATWAQRYVYSHTGSPALMTYVNQFASYKFEYHLEEFISKLEEDGTLRDLQLD